jgi:hypothetical protein
MLDINHYHELLPIRKSFEYMENQTLLHLSRPERLGWILLLSTASLSKEFSGDFQKFGDAFLFL